jgi:hypothetical protein
MATVTYHGEGEIDYLAARSSSPKFEAEVRKIRQGPSAMVVVRAKPPFEVGEHKAVVTVETSCRPQPNIEVPVSLRQPEPIEVVPEEVTLPAQTRQLQRQTVSITNHGNRSLSILGVETSNPGIRWQFYPEPDGFSYKLELILSPSVEYRPEGETITIRTDDDKHARIVIPIRAGGPKQG